MATRRWELDLEDGRHTVELVHEYLSGRRTVSVDGETVFHQDEQVLDFGSKHPVSIGGHEGVVRIRTTGLTFHYSLLVDGRSFGKGEKVSTGG